MGGRDGGFYKKSGVRVVADTSEAEQEYEFPDKINAVDMARGAITAGDIVESAPTNGY